MRPVIVRGEEFLGVSARFRAVAELYPPPAPPDAGPPLMSVYLVARDWNGNPLASHPLIEALPLGSPMTASTAMGLAHAGQEWLMRKVRHEDTVSAIKEAWASLFLMLVSEGIL